MEDPIRAWSERSKGESHSIQSLGLALDELKNRGAVRAVIAHPLLPEHRRNQVIDPIFGFIIPSSKVQNPLIYGGERVTGAWIDATAGVGALFVNGKLECTATVIQAGGSWRTLLTAAHCLRQVRDPRTQLRFAIGVDANAPQVKLEVDGIDINPGYEPNKHGVNDIALVYLRDKLSGRYAVYLPRPGLSNKWPVWANQSLAFVGYGYANNAQNGEPNVGIRRVVRMPVAQVDPTRFLYGVEGKQTCNIDSGGPALASVGGQTWIVGVTSYGDTACAQYGVDMRVDSYLDWIKLNAK